MFWRRQITLVAACMLLLSITACQQPKEETTPTDTNDKPSVETPVDENASPSTEQAAVAPQPPEPPKPTMPEVQLTDTLAKTCLVKVDDQLPEGKLADQNGQVVELQSKLGPKMTVLCFWNGDDIYALEELQQLERHIAGPYADKGVNVIAINPKDTPQVAAEKVQMTGATYPSLLDPDGAYFAKLATEGLPRTYLVDDQGKILWFDTEYSRGTLRDLRQAIDFVLLQ